MRELTTEEVNPITKKEAKALGLHQATKHYLESERWMAENALKHWLFADIKARFVRSPIKIPNAVEVWKA
tara:strand:- start:61 stop:270 length:210 start_codon:yes stop_codon:yes gene_type:complete